MKRAEQNNRPAEHAGVTRIDLAELIAMRAQAGKPGPARVHIRTAQAGGHVSTLRGRGMDYAESRIYQAGDDARNIDWRRTARSGKWHTKLFQAERERSLLLLMDTHATMRFGTRLRYKSVAAARAAAWLVWTAVRTGDRVGALAFGAVRAAIDPHAGTPGALNLLGGIAHWDQQAQSAPATTSEPLSEALKRAQRMTGHGSHAWLISDGWCTDDAATAALARLAQRVDLRVIIVADPLECELVPAGAYTFETGSTRHAVALTEHATREAFLSRLSQGRANLATACAAAGVMSMLMTTTAAPERVLSACWRQRVRRS